MNRSFIKAAWTTSVLMLALAMAQPPPAAAKTIFQDDAVLYTCHGFPGSATRRLRQDQQGNFDLRVQVSGGLPGSYVVLVAGGNRGTLVVDAFGQGQLEWDTSPGPGQLLMNFSISVGTEIDLMFGTAVAYSLTNDPACINSPGPGSSSTSSTTSTSSTSSSSTSTSNATTTSAPTTSAPTTSDTNATTTSAPTTSDTNATTTSAPTTSDTNASTTTISSSSSTSTTLGGSTCQAWENLVSLKNCTTRRGVTGSRRVRQHIDCDQDLRIEIQKVVNGTYDVYIGNTKRGTITTKSGSGQIEFDTSPAANEFPLTPDIDPFGNVAIRQGTKTYLAYPNSNCP